MGYRTDIYLSSTYAHFIDSPYPCGMDVVFLLVLLEEREGRPGRFVQHTAGR